MSVAWLFPGQGSQGPRIGWDLCEAFSSVRARVEEAGLNAGLDLVSCLETGSAAELADTHVAQVLVLALSTGAAEVLADRGAVPSVVAGHSLGEISALVAGGWLTWEAALPFVAARAQAMRECCLATAGAMTAVMGLTIEQVATLCARHESLAVANINSDSQVVLSGRVSAVAAAEHDAEVWGASAARLPVAGAYHSELMRPAGDAMAPLIAALPLRRGTVALVSSMDGQVVTEPETYRRQLSAQIVSPVRWSDAARRVTSLAGSGVEVGPGRVLRNLMRRVQPGWSVASTGDLTSVRACLAEPRELVES